MICKDFIPSVALTDYINRYRLRHFVFDDGIKVSFKPFPPRPEQCLIFYPRGMEITEYPNDGKKVRLPRSVVSGQFIERINRYVSHPEFLMITVDMKPGALHRITGIPFKELTNQNIDAELIFNSKIRVVNERLGSIDSYTEMIAFIESFFLQLLKNTKKEFLAVDHVLNVVAKSSDIFSLDHLAQMAYLSARQLERKFDERIGINPKTFLRISRFNQSYWMRLKYEKLDWLSIAIRCGYTDYQHLVKDYKDFANTTPNIFFAEEKLAPGRVLGLNK
jgi:AraC-like DNA-binding protein